MSSQVSEFCTNTRARKVHHAYALAFLFVLASVSSTSQRAAAQANGGLRVAAESNSIELNVGEQRVMSAQGVKTYSEGVKGVIDIRLTSDSSRFVIVGTNKGTTTLLMIMVDGSERVFTITVKDPRDVNMIAAGPDPLAVTAQASVRLDLYFVQVSRTNSVDFGMNIPSQVGAGTFSAIYDIPAAALVSKSAVVSASFLPTLDMAQAKGWAKIRRHIAVITSNGTEANFDSGGEFNALGGGLTSTVVKIKYGTVLTVRPRYDAKTNRIEMSVTAEVADLTPGAPLPGRTQSSVSTTANLALGESLSVAGLVSSNMEKNRTGIPFLSQIPILGLLFGRQGNKESETENVVFISPSIVEPLKHARAKEFLSDAIREYDDFSGQEGKRKLFPGTPYALPTARTADRP